MKKRLRSFIVVYFTFDLHSHRRMRADKKMRNFFAKDNQSITTSMPIGANIVEHRNKIRNNESNSNNEMFLVFFFFFFSSIELIQNLFPYN